MIFTDEVIGSFAICSINPNMLPVIPQGLLFIAYGMLKKSNKPFTIYKLIPFSRDDFKFNKHWPSRPDAPFRFEYFSNQSVRIQVFHKE